MLTDEHCSQYYGEWKPGDEIRQGRGIMVRVSGERYEGYFVNNKFEGNGHMIYSEDPA